MGSLKSCSLLWIDNVFCSGDGKAGWDEME